MIHSVLVAVDTSPRAFEVMSAARAWASMLDADAHVLHVLPAGRATDKHRRQARDLLISTALRAGLRLACPPLITHGELCDSILRMAAELQSDAIVVGARVDQARIGVEGIAAILQQRAPVNVFVVQPRNAY